MSAEIEPLAGVIRYWEHENAQYGDQYQWAATIRWVNKETIEVLGVTTPPTVTIWKEVRNCAKRIGVRYITFIRYKNGIERSTILSL